MQTGGDGVQILRNGAAAPPSPRRPEDRGRSKERQGAAPWQGRGGVRPLAVVPGPLTPPALSDFAEPL